MNSGNVVLYFVKRSANSVAHLLTRASYFIYDRTWEANNALPEIVAASAHVLLLS